MSAGNLVNSRYLLLDKLGEGGMGTVYRAADRLTGQTIALKRVTADGDQLQFASQSTDQDFRLSLAQEFRTLAGLRHPHIVSVLDYGFDDQKQPFFTMQLIENAQTITHYAFEIAVADKVRLIIEMLQALAYLHRRDILHRDLKPANVLVTPDGTVKMMDFGLALHQSESITNMYTGAVGTLAYMAPELFADTPATIQSDLYSIGLMAYEIFVGKYPFNTKNLAILVNTILNEKPNTLMLDLDLADVLDKLLAKNSQDRYDNIDKVIEDLCAATGQPVPPEKIALRESFLQAAKFVGREAELQQLLTALEAVRSGKGSAWLLGGESGVGKSRLLDELRTRALVTETLVIQGQAVEGGGLPYQLWRTPLRRLVLATPLSDMEAGILKPLIPDISTLIGREIPDIPELDGAAGQQRLSLTIGEVFKRQQQPTLVLIEDLQWTAESLAPLKQLLSLVADLPLLVVGTYRDDEKPDLPADVPDMQLLKLARLTDDDIARLSESMLGEAGKQARVIDLLKRETEGNTFFMVEVVRALAEDAGRLQDIAFMTLPEKVFAGGVQQVIQRRLERVPAEFRSMVTLAAAAGRQPDLTVLEYVFRQEAAAPVNLDHWLTICASASVLEFNDGHWRFTHDKIREFILREARPEVRQALYQTLALAVEKLYPANEAYVVILADYWYQANKPQKALDYISRAAHQLFKISSFREALLLVERGLAMPEVGDYAAELHNIAGNIYIRYGNYEQSLSAYELCLKLAKNPVDLSAGLDGLCEIYWRQGKYEEALKIAEDALLIVQAANHQKGIATVLGAFGIIALYQGNFIEAQTRFEQTLSLARSMADLQSTALSLDHLGIAARMAGNYDQAKTYLHESMTLARQIGDLEGVGSALNNLGALQGNQGDMSGARQYFEQALAIQREIGNLYSIALSLTNLGIVSLYLEDYPTTEAYLQQGLTLQRKIDDPQSAVLSLTHLVAMHLKQQQWMAAQPIMREAIETGLKINAVPILLALVGYVVEFWTLPHGKQEQAALWLGMMQNHSASFGEVRDQVEKLLPQIAPATLATAMERGKNLDLETVLNEILAEFDKEAGHEHYHEDHQPLSSTDQTG